MDITLIKTISDTAFKEGRDVIETWFAVMSRGHKGVSPERGRQPRGSAVFYGLRFTLYMAFASLLLEIPTEALMGIQYENKAFILVSVVESYIEYLGCGLAFHAAMRVFGGKGTLRAALTVSCLLTAYMPVMGFFLIPTQKYTLPIIRKSSNVLNAGSDLLAVARTWSTWDRVVCSVSIVAGAIVLVLFITAVFNSLRALHQIGRMKAVLSFVLGLVLFVLIVSFIASPLLQGIFQAFS
jgi:hypothetical protein